MTVRNPIELQMQINTPDKIENCGNIVLIIGLNKEYENPNHVILDNSLPSPTKIVIQHVRDMRDEPVRFWNMNQRLLRGKKLEFSELLLANNWSDGLKSCNGKNPFAVIDFRHGDRILGIGDGNKEWERASEIAALINENKGTIQFISLPMCESWYIGNDLSKHTTKIKMLDARNKDKPIDGIHLFDGLNDTERREQKSTRTYELWKNHFVDIQEDYVISLMIKRLAQKPIESEKLVSNP